MKRIKDVSNIAGITKRTLQYYDDEGLLNVKRSKSNDRLYTEEDLNRLWEILIYKDLGMKLSQIKDMITLEGIAKDETLINHIEHMRKMKANLEKQICMAEKIYKYGIPKENFEERKENSMEYMRKISICSGEK